MPCMKKRGTETHESSVVLDLLCFGCGSGMDRSLNKKSFGLVFLSDFFVILIW